MANRPPQKFEIEISLDKANNFLYKEHSSGKDATSIVVINDDQITWVLDRAIPERSLQIDFGNLNPFHLYTNVVLRGHGHVTSDPVSFSRTYPFNRQLKYTVTLGNGWSDDPDVVPVENDGGLRKTLAVATDFAIAWTSNQFTAVALTPAELSKSANGGATALVTWQWNVGANDPTPPFTLVFANPVPPGWPPSTDATPGITLSLAPGPRTKFTIEAFAGDGSPISVDGYLTITA